MAANTGLLDRPIQTAGDRRMAKRKDPTEQVRIYKETAADVRQACSALGIEFADYIRDRLRPALREDLVEAARINQERAKAQSKKSDSK